MLMLTAPIALQSPQAAQPPQSTQSQAPKQPESETVIQKILRIVGITVDTGGLRGDSSNGPGNVWLVEADTQKARALTVDGMYRTPIFELDGQYVLAMK